MTKAEALALRVLAERLEMAECSPTLSNDYCDLTETERETER
jgi:hypothetical protein